LEPLVANHTSTLAIKLLDGISGPAKGAAASLGAISKATEALGKVKGFREQTQRLEEMTRAHAKAREGVRNLAGQLIAAEAPSAKMKAAYERATAAADKLGNKLEWQKARVRGAASELERMGVAANNLSGAEARLKAHIERTTAAMLRQEQVSRRRAAAGGVAAAAATGVGIKAANTGRNIAVRAVEDAAALDIAQKKQTSFSGISAEAQARILAPQAKKIAFDTQFSTLDVTKAQTATLAGLPDHLDKAGVARSLVEQAKNVAMALGSNMEEAAESMRGYLAARVADMSTAEAAERSARNAANRMIRAAKLGGMSAEDVAQFTKYGGASARAAGISEDNTLALGIALRRAGVRGDEAGVAVRSFAGKLVAPTKKGRAAMLAAGIDHDKFTTMPGGMSTENLSKTMASEVGLKLNDATRAAIEQIHSDDEIVTDRGKYAAAVAEAIEENAGKKLSTKDSEAKRAVMTPRSAGQSASGKPLPKITAEYGVNLISWSMSPTISRPAFKKFERRFYDPVEAKWKREEFEAREVGTGIEAVSSDRFAAADKDDAKRGAESSEKEADRDKGGGSVSIDGEPLAQAEAECELVGARPGIDGTYRIESVTHKYTRGGGYTTDLDLKQPKGEAGKDSRKSEPAAKAPSGGASGRNNSALNTTGSGGSAAA